MRKRNLALLQRRNLIHQISEQVMGEQGYVISYDIVDRTDFPLRLVTNVLSQNARQWGWNTHYHVLTTAHGYSEGVIKAYTKEGGNPPRPIDLSNYKAHRLPENFTS